MGGFLQQMREVQQQILEQQESIENDSEEHKDEQCRESEMVDAY